MSGFFGICWMIRLSFIEQIYVFFHLNTRSLPWSTDLDKINWSPTFAGWGYPLGTRKGDDGVLNLAKSRAVGLFGDYEHTVCSAHKSNAMHGAFTLATVVYCNAWKKNDILFARLIILSFFIDESIWAQPLLKISSHSTALSQPATEFDRFSSAEDARSRAQQTTGTTSGTLCDLHLSDKCRRRRRLRVRPLEPTVPVSYEKAKLLLARFINTHGDTA